MAWLWFIGTGAAQAALFAAGLRAPLGRGRLRWAVRTLGVLGALAAALLANIIVYRHDLHLDLTREEAFTPAPETREILRNLAQDVDLVYFYQAQNPAGRAAKQMLEIIGREYPRLHVRTVDPDQQPALANRYGVRMYNAALLLAGGQRIEVISTDDREIALGILRLLRRDTRPVCFLSGHGEYDIDNFEFHTHFEGSHGHSHDAGGMAVVKMEQHGIGRLRRALDKLGYTVRKISLAAAGAVPAECTSVVMPNPRTAYTPPEVTLLGRYLEAGSNLLVLLEPDYELGPDLAGLLARAGVRVGAGVIIDPTSHYYTDEQMVAVEKYAAHPATVGLALSFFPGARPLQPMPVPGVRTQVLFSTSTNARVVEHAVSPTSAAQSGESAVRPLAIAAEGRLGASAQSFRLAVVGDADFASNSFYPYLSNADLALGLTAWVRGESRGPTLKPPVEVLPMVVMTNGQMQAIFVICVLALPGLCALLGAWVWWQRRY